MAFQAQSFNKYNPQTTQILQQLLQQGTQGLQNFKPTSFEPYAAKAREGFASQTVPLLAERFGRMAGESSGSSGFTAGLAGAASDLDSTLAMLGAQHDSGQQAQAMQLYQLMTQLGLGSQETALQEEEPGWGRQLGNAALDAAPAILGGIGMAAGGPVGAGAGGGIAALLKYLLGGKQEEAQQEQQPFQFNMQSPMANLGSTAAFAQNPFNFQKR